MRKIAKNYFDKMTALILKNGGISIMSDKITEIFTSDELSTVTSGESHDRRVFLVRTLAGVYQITICKDRYDVFGRFVDADRAWRRGFIATPHCGKLNFHTNTEKDALASVHNFFLITVKPATEKLEQDVLPINKHEAHLDVIVSEMTNQICKKINANASEVNADTRYKAQYILETLIKELETRV